VTGSGRPEAGQQRDARRALSPRPCASGCSAASGSRLAPPGASGRTGGASGRPATCSSCSAWQGDTASRASGNPLPPGELRAPSAGSVSLIALTGVGITGSLLACRFTPCRKARRRSRYRVDAEWTEKKPAFAVQSGCMFQKRDASTPTRDPEVSAWRIRRVAGSG
jgi:hypothetical protein